MEEQEMAPPKEVKINDQCEPRPKRLPIKRREGLFWTNQSNGDVSLRLPDIFDPPPSQNPLPIPYGGTSETLLISGKARMGEHPYEVTGTKCPGLAPRIGTIDVEN